MHRCTPIHELAEVEIVGHEQGLASDGENKHLIVGDPWSQVGDLSDIMAVGPQPLCDQPVNVLVDEDVHPVATETTRSARRASIA